MDLIPYLNQLQSFGLPTTTDNARIKHYPLFDTITVATGTNDYNLFTNPTLSLFNRNRVLPIGANEILLIGEISAIVEGLVIEPSTNLSELLTRSYLRIMINDQEKLKIPLAEVLNYFYGEAAVTTSMIVTEVKRKRNLQFPLIVNSSANVTMQVALPTNAVSILNGKNIRFEFTCIKYDKLSSYNVDFRKSGVFERLSYTFFDTNAFTFGNAATYDLFNARNRAVNDFSKVFPLGNTEVFSIENIEIVLADSSTYAEWQALQEALARGTLKIIVNDVEFFNGLGKDLLYHLGGKGGSATPYSMHVLQNGGLTLLTPITIPSDSRVKITLDVPATTHAAGGTHYFSVLLKGTYQRIVS